jgi:hypothetical protein
MEALRVETIVQPDGSLKLEGLPSTAGQPVEVIVLPRDPVCTTQPYSLRGTPVTYVAPTEPLSPEDWEAQS